MYSTNLYNTKWHHGTTPYTPHYNYTTNGTALKSKRKSNNAIDLVTGVYKSLNINFSNCHKSS